MIETKFDAGKPDSANPIERVSSRPDFNVLIYPWYRPGATKAEETPLFPIPADAPPVFMVCTTEDRSHVEPTVKFYMELEAKAHSGGDAYLFVGTARVRAASDGKTAAGKHVAGPAEGLAGGTEYLEAIDGGF